MTKTELSKLIGYNLSKYRLESNLTREQLAEKIGINASYCAALENGKKSMSLLVLWRFADVLNVNVDALMGESHLHRSKNIAVVLENQSVEFTQSMEKLIRLCVNEFVDNER